ncbi:MAG TPA: hypothetical protein ENF92_08055 [Desulfobacteraceae bacterium]|nr:CoA-binding protein [Deltaproteobacteria bacterium]HDM10452.1 hypothetical protein [Desulfobacteraceae bacterium]
MDFSPLFKPKTMAVIGVSLQNDLHPANVIFRKNHSRYPVKAFAVNPRGGTLQGEQVYTSISEVPEKIDLAVIAARAEQVPSVLAQCIEAGVGGAAIISGGLLRWAEKPLIAYVPHVEKFRMLIEGFELNGVPVSHSIEAAVLMAEALKRRRRS